MNRQQAIERLLAAWREQRAAALAVRYFQAASVSDLRSLDEEELERGDLKACQRNLATTYVIRLFAEFEECLRLYWRHGRRRKSWNTVGAEALIQSIGAYRDVPPGFIADAQEVRRLRNNLVHAPGGGRASGLSLDKCRSRLVRFLSYLPLSW